MCRGNSEEHICRAQEIAISSVVAIDGGKMILYKWEKHRSSAKHKLDHFEQRLRDSSLIPAS